MTRCEDFALSIRYNRSEEDALEECLLGLEDEIGGDLAPGPEWPDHLDLRAALELALSFKVDEHTHPWLARYSAGALGPDALRHMGAAQRIAVEEWEARLAEGLRRMLASVHKRTHAG